METATMTKEKQQKVVARINRNRLKKEEVVAMGLSTCNVKCLSTGVANGKYIGRL